MPSVEISFDVDSHRENSGVTGCLIFGVREQSGSRVNRCSCDSRNVLFARCGCFELSKTGHTMKPLQVVWMITLACLLDFMNPVVARAQSHPSFERDVRPILSRYCFKCHGPDELQRQGGLRLDLRESAVAKSDSGKTAIVPSQPEVSELLRRIALPEGSEERMPPASTKMELTADQKEILKKWITAGAEYRPHWAFVAPKRPVLPRVRDASWPQNGIDHFVLARLEAEGLRPALPADRYTLARRVFLDLIGIPPTPTEVDEFVNDSAPDAYHKLVERLLASPNYGERWARRWLDLARYADTNGYEKDRQRSVWPYRDWVINAINADMPFDQFTIEQLAGDMLPNATIEQRIATGFHRNTMLNEEGGIDPLEFRFHAMTDRVATTGSVWLGLTVGCAQCHTHKYDPIAHTDYYRFFSLLNNADEPEFNIPVADIVAKQNDVDRHIAELEADLPNRFPLPDEFEFEVARPASVTVANGVLAETLDDGAVRVGGDNPEKATYSISFDSDVNDVAAIRLETLTDAALPSTGPGRTPHGNFVLTELTASVAAADQPDKAQPVKLVRASADVEQTGFPIANAIDGKPETGWAIDVVKPLNHNRAATFVIDRPVKNETGKKSRWTIVLDQQFGKQHTIGKFRISLGKAKPASGSVEEQRRQQFTMKFNDWLTNAEKQAVRWTPLRPISAKSNLPLLTIEEDGSVFASGDFSKSDLYEVALQSDFDHITAVRLEALPDERLPKFGPGRVYYEGPFGDFFLSDIELATKGDSNGTKTLRFSRATQTFAAGNNTATAALDDNKQTGWSINGGQGKPHTAVFQLAQPLSDAKAFTLRMLFERYYAPGLGRFKVSVTNDPRAVDSTILPDDVEAALLTARDQRTARQISRLQQHFVSVAPELASERQSIEAMRSQRPTLPTSLVMQERPANNPRPTFRHHRGEYLQPKERVESGVLAFLSPLPREALANRFELSRWLVSSDNPLTARVTVNRHWSAFFGRGLVKTQEDFGFQGALPSHPELLDWLAAEFVGSGNANSPLSFSLKRLHRLIVTSATYQQSSRVTDELLRRDAANELLARGPRFRLDAEVVRDSLLGVSGLIGRKLNGPSVFPPQPSSITTEGTYGQLAWNVSTGFDRYRRSLYTFAKRTAPFAMFTTFDAPSGEACVCRREVSNTPLQALTLLNDITFVEASQAFGREFSGTGNDDEKLIAVFRRCLTRPPTADEQRLLREFIATQRARLVAKQLDAEKLGGAGEGDSVERAVWTVVARAILNLDEAVTKN